jgi:hypothetical protein
MNGSAENRASGASEKPERRENNLKLATARSMLPLVERIVGDILQSQVRLTQLMPEQDRLDRRRRELDWPDRARRYQVHEEISEAERRHAEALAELASLGLQLVDSDAGRVGFPTIVNGRRAFFSWQPGDDGIAHWQFPDEAVRRAIPASWNKQEKLSLSGKN